MESQLPCSRVRTLVIVVTELQIADPNPVLSQGDAEFYKLCFFNLSM
jgi:hypothetical protein